MCRSNGGVSGTPANSTINTTFPAGTYRIETYLSTVTTNCTSNPATWLCYPYSTYAQSPSAAAASFDWVITPTGPNTYALSSTPNIFSIVITNASLSLQNSGTAEEHYFFSTPSNKETRPATQLGSQNVAATCEFKDTVLQGFLYTKMSKTYPSNSTSTAPFAPWPYAVRFEQAAEAELGIPDCTDPSGQSLGDFSVTSQGQVCQCLYQNTGT